MTRRKLKFLELQNTKTKNLQSSDEEKQIPHLCPCETSHKENEDLQNDKKKIKDSEISKYKNKKLSKFTRRKANNPFPPSKLHTNFFKDPQNDKKKV